MRLGVRVGRLNGPTEDKKHASSNEQLHARIIIHEARVHQQCAADRGYVVTLLVAKVACALCTLHAHVDICA